MKLAIIKESAANESRVALTPDVVKDYLNAGFSISLEKDAGKLAGFSDKLYKEQGVTIAKDAKTALNNADLVLKIQAPDASELKLIPEKATLVCLLASELQNKKLFQQLNKQHITSYGLELVPRITRAQSMDVLSSQSNLAGYKAVIDAVASFHRVLPMMMTAAGTIRPAKVLILGAGVAGLQAIATAKRLGAVVSAFDVRTVAKEQVESLGASFVEVPVEDNNDAETSGGYAKEMDEEYKRKQSVLIHDTLKETDIAICTALIPGRPAPTLITKEMVQDMQPGSVIVDLATITGGNCECSKKDEVAVQHDVTIIGYTNMPGRLAFDASKLFAKNLLSFTSLLLDKEEKKLITNQDDEIIKASLLTYEGNNVHPLLTDQEA